ncbi:hypothetical protein ACOME3_006239 [Neoechinorhynchus agilis]
MNPEIIEVLQEILAQVDNKLENAEREMPTTEQIDLTDIKIIDGHDSEPKDDREVEISRKGLLDVELKETNDRNMNEIEKDQSANIAKWPSLVGQIDAIIVKDIANYDNAGVIGLEMVNKSLAAKRKSASYPVKLLKSKNGKSCKNCRTKKSVSWFYTKEIVLCCKCAQLTLTSPKKGSNEDKNQKLPLQPPRVKSVPNLSDSSANTSDICCRRCGKGRSSEWYSCYQLILCKGCAPQSATRLTGILSSSQASTVNPNENTSQLQTESICAVSNIDLGVKANKRSTGSNKKNSTNFKCCNKCGSNDNSILYSSKGSFTCQECTSSNKQASKIQHKNNQEDELECKEEAVKLSHYLSLNSQTNQNPELEDKTGDTGDIRCCIKCGMSEISKLFDYCGLCLCEKCIEASIPKDQTNIAVEQSQDQNEDNFNEAFSKRTIEPTKRKHPETSSTRAKRAKVQRQCNRCKVVVSRIRYRRNELYYCNSCAIIEGFLDAKTSSAVKTKKAVMRTGDLKCSSIKQGQKSLKRGVPLDQIEQQPRTKSRRTRMQESSTLNRSATEPLKPSPFLEETLQTLGRLINLSSAQSELIQQSNKLTSNVPSMNWTPTLNSMLISAARISAEVQAEKDRSEKQSGKDLCDI